MALNSKIKFVQGDITKQTTEAIVNAANSSLMGGGGVDGAIHRVGGPKILQECKEIVAKQGRLPTGQAVITSGGNLPAKYVIHTVGPIYSRQKAVSGRQKAELGSCYTESLKLAAEHGLKSVSFPSISTGAYGYPIEEAAEIAIRAVHDFFSKESSIEEVCFVLFDERTFQAYLQTGQRF
jgi:O-acetyl-ADP-ribose deacetylase (regulator of RNase III)